MPAKAQAGDLPIVETAARQHGVIARGQLQALGYTRNQIQGRLARGRLHQLHRGVYAVGHTRLTQRGRRMAAVLAYGPKALLSHRSAAALWGVIRPPGSSADVLVAGCRARRPGVRIHSTRCLDREDRATHDGIPLTSLPRTLIDLAAVIDRAALARAIEESDRLGLFDLRSVERLLERGPRRPGSRALRLTLSIYRDPAFTRSELERRFLRLVKEAGLPRPYMNAFVAGHEVDVVWEREGS